MTEKRFKEYYQGKTIVSVHDTKNNNELVNILQCVDLLNRIADENEQLKKIIEDNVDFNTIFSDRDLNDICNEMGYELSENEIKLRRLEKENEQLKQQCKDFMEMLDDMCIAYLVNDGLEEILNG